MSTVGIREVISYNMFFSLAHLHTHVLQLHACVGGTLVPYKPPLLGTHAHQSAERPVLHMASIWQNSLLLGPVWMCVCVCVWMCACLCATQTPNLYQTWLKEFQLASCSPALLPAVLSDTHTHTFTQVTQVTALQRQSINFINSCHSFIMGYR